MLSVDVGISINLRDLFQLQIYQALNYFNVNFIYLTFPSPNITTSRTYMDIVSTSQMTERGNVGDLNSYAYNGIAEEVSIQLPPLSINTTTFLHTSPQFLEPPTQNAYSSKLNPLTHPPPPKVESIAQDHLCPYYYYYPSSPGSDPSNTSQSSRS